MAKRKRLKPAALTRFPTTPKDPEAALETKSGYPFGVAPAPTRAPIAQVAGDAASQAALEELAHELLSARESGRIVQRLMLDEINADHLLRDRMVSDPEEMAGLKASLMARGQQTPIEVVDMGQGAYGLISGWRRLAALRELHDETGEIRFASVQALIRPIDSVSDSYVAMVEENEIRANLSFYERARLASEAARLGVYATSAQAVQALFANATSAKRSKINTFVRLHEALGEALSFPAAIPERLGLALTKALDEEPALAARIKDTLRKTPPADADQERGVLERALRKMPEKASVAPTAEVVPGIKLEAQKGRVVLSGKGVTEALQRDLTAWLSSR